MAIGDGVALRWSLANESSAALWCSMTVEKPMLLCRLPVRGSGPAGKRGSLCPLALKIARVRRDRGGEGMQNCNPLFALFPIQSPNA